MFENLTDRLQKVFRDLRGYGRLTPENIDEALRQVRLALLEADVNYKVVKEFIDAISARAVGQDVLESLTPGQQVIKIVHQELIDLLGGQTELLKLDGRQPVVIMLAGLQGSGKTTDEFGCIKIRLADSQVDDAGNLIGQGEHDADARPLDRMGSV